MILSIIRWCIFGGIIFVAVALWRYVATTLFDLLSFHISVYEYILQGQDVVWSIWSKAQETLREWFWWSEAQNIVQQQWQPQPTLEERFATYTQKVRIVCGLIWFIIATQFYAFLSRIIFRFKEHIQAVKSFIYK